MKSFVVLLLALCIATSVFAQEKTILSPESAKFKVQYLSQRQMQPLFIVDGVYSTQSIIKSLPHDCIDSISVIKEDLEVNGVEYSGKIYIITKTNYRPQLISLIDLKNTYLKPLKEPVVFLIDDFIVNEDYNLSLVNTKHILKLVVENVIQEDVAVNIVQVLTKNEENIRKASEIRIKGLEETRD